MAMVLNPITGEMEDDGTGPANAVTGAPNVAPPTDPAPMLPSNTTAEGEGGGSTLGTEGNPMIATIARAPKPPVEIVNTRQTPVQSKQELDANARMNVANELVTHAIRNQQGTDESEAKITQQTAADKIAALEAQKVREFEVEQENKREEEAVATHARTLAEDRARKQIAAGRARADYFKGNFVGDIVAALVQSVAAGLHAQAGKDGLSPAERVFENAYANHEKGLLAEYEASKQGAEDYKNNRPIWEAHRAARKAKAAQDAIHDMAMASAVADRSLAALGPEKAANARDMKIALEQRAAAKADQELATGLRGMRKSETTTRPMGDGTVQGEAAWSPKPMGREERQAYGYGSIIMDAMGRSGKILLTKDTLKRFQSNFRQLQHESPGIVTNFLRQNDLHVLPDDFFAGIDDPEQRKAIRDWSNAANAQIRQESGAAIPPPEALSNAYRNIPTTSSPAAEQRRLRDDMINVAQRMIPRKIEAKAAFDQAEKLKKDLSEDAKPKPEKVYKDGESLGEHNGFEYRWSAAAKGGKGGPVKVPK